MPISKNIPIIVISCISGLSSIINMYSEITNNIITEANGSILTYSHSPHSLRSGKEYFPKRIIAVIQTDNGEINPNIISFDARDPIIK